MAFGAGAAAEKLNCRDRDMLSNFGVAEEQPVNPAHGLGRIASATRLLLISTNRAGRQDSDVVTSTDRFSGSCTFRTNYSQTSDRVEVPIPLGFLQA